MVFPIYGLSKASRLVVTTIDWLKFILFTLRRKNKQVKKERNVSFVSCFTLVIYKYTYDMSMFSIRPGKPIKLMEVNEQ